MPRGLWPTIDNAVQSGIGELEGQLRAAHAHYLNLIAEQDAAIATANVPSAASALDAQQAFQMLARAARDMTMFMFDNAGTAVVFATSPVQRCLRDIFTGLKHGILTPAILGRIGKVRLGLDDGEIRFYRAMLVLSDLYLYLQILVKCYQY